MRRLISFLALAASAAATDPTLSYPRYWQSGPQTVYRGYTHLFGPVPMWSMLLDCRASDSTCVVHAGTYSPDGTEVLELAEANLTAGGFPNPTPLPAPGFPPGFYAVDPVTYAPGADGTGRFALAMASRQNGGRFKTTSYLSSAGTTTATVPACVAGQWPHIPDALNPNGVLLGLQFSGNGSSIQARYRITTDASGNISNPVMLDGGGNFSTVPTAGTINCLNASGVVQTYSNVPFTGGKLGHVFPITADGTITVFIKLGGHAPVTARPYLKNPAGTNWPSGTTMTYWNGGTTDAVIYLMAGVKPGMLWFPFVPVDVNQVGVEVSIAANAPLGPVSAGWTFCKDAALTDCTDVLRTITVADVPTYALSPPINPPPLPDNFTMDPTPCLASYPDPSRATAIAGSNCSFNHLLTSNDQNGYGHWWPPGVRGSTPPGNPDYQIELNASPQYVTYGAAGSACPATACGWFYDFARIGYWISQWTGDNSWLNPARLYLSRYGQIGPGVPGVPPAPPGQFNYLALPYNTGSTTPYSVPFMYANHPWGVATNLALFNSGQYTDTVQRKWSAEMAQVLYRGSYVESTPGFTPGDTSFMGKGTVPWGSAATTLGGVIASWIANGLRYSTFGIASKLEIARVLNPPQRNADGSLTLFGLQFKLATEVLQTLGLELLNPAPSGPYDAGPYADQPYSFGLYLEEVIDHYELTHDPLDLHIIHGVLAYLYSYYHPDTRTFPQITANNGPFCAGGVYYTPGTAWYATGPPPVLCNDDTTNYIPYAELNGMNAFPPAWFWARFGGSDNTYALWADMLAFDSIAYSTSVGWRYTPKGSNEQYGRDGFRYIAERQLRGSSR